MLPNCHFLKDKAIPYVLFLRYEGQRDMLYNQTFNLDQVAFAAEGLKDAQQTVCDLDSFVGSQFDTRFYFPNDFYKCCLLRCLH